jgi:hypothetical protein
VPQGIAERNAEAADPRGYRWEGEKMQSMILEAQLVRKGVWNGHLVNLGFPSWRTRNRVFDRVLTEHGVGADVFDGQPDHLEILLGIYLRGFGGPGAW